MTDVTRRAVLDKYGLTPGERFGAGMEAEVYRLGAQRLLKLYRGAGRLAELDVLRDFYAGLERAALPYEVPSIEQVAAEGEYCVSIERRLEGTPLSTLLPGLGREQLDQAMDTYLDALLALGRLTPPAELERYRLLDPQQLSLRREGDFHHFLGRFLAYKLAQVAPFLGRDVSDLAGKVAQMQALLAQPYRGELRLVHGDFYPGNLLVDERRRVSGLLDFGFMTLYGDPYFDLATAWVFFDMYDELKAHLRERLLALLLERVGAAARGKLFRYVLLYSLLTANAYSAACADGHYQWCVANLNRADYWAAIE